MADDATGRGGGGAGLPADATASMERALSALDDALRNDGGNTGKCDERKTGEQSNATSSSGDSSHLQDTEAATCDASGGGGNNNDDRFSPSAYRRRLGTFLPSTYFAKPKEVSPLEAARFGWINSSRDMLTCESAACRAAICVDINPLLSSESASKLARRYRTMLATAHAPTCPFRSDAERWLLDEESKHQSDGFAVPPYLLSMSDDYALLENVLQHGGGLVSRKMIRLAAIELSEQFEKADMGVANLSLTVPQTAIDLMKEEAVATALGDGATVKSLAGVVYSALGEELSEDNVDAGLVKVLNDDDDFSNVASNAPLLAAFGWRVPLETSDTQEEGTNCSVVECRLCLARSDVFPESEIIEDAPPTKRQRTTHVSSRPKAVDLVRSHRHHCPYVCRTANNTIGWKAILSMLMKQQREKENKPSGQKDTSSGQKTFESVRSLLRSSLPTDISKS